MIRIVLAVFLLLVFSACSHPPCPRPATVKATPVENSATNATKTKQSAPTVAEAEQFVSRIERDLLELWSRAERAAWLKQTHISADTAVIAAQAQEAVMAYTQQAAKKAVRFDSIDLPFDLKRKLKLLKLSLSLPGPPQAADRAELAQIATKLDATYGKGKVCSKTLARAHARLTKTRRAKGDECLSLGQLSDIMAKSRDYDLLLEAWQGWRQVAIPMRESFSRYVELANKGAQSLGFADLGELWKSRYDMTPAQFEQEVDRLWLQLKPLYEQLHCYVRAKLQKQYGKKRVPDGAPIPAHLLGNMWSQEWTALKKLLLPDKRGGSIDLERSLKRKRVDARKMVRYGEGFFVSLGLTQLPKTFWQRSMFTKPRDREVVCHASAWDVNYVDDLRIKMCIKINDEDFTTVHHELGHNYYQYYYRKQTALYRDSANDGFHEGLGDTISLSVTPSYLVQVGLLKKEPQAQLNPLMERALEKIAFLPFGVLIDRWRWEVFSGKVKKERYNDRWWELRRRYQGIVPPVARGPEAFDPGAKYHIPANVPYTRYFLAAILQFQFHRALCKLVGHKGPLHRCSIYGNKEAGARLRAMMELGLSRPWPEALKVLTGETRMDASAIVAYFKPLLDWLKEQNQGRQCGW